MTVIVNGVPKLDGATEEPLRVGDSVLEFVRKDQNGNDVSLDSFRGRRLLLVISNGVENDLAHQKLTNLNSCLPTVVASGLTALVVADSYFARNRKFFESLENNNGLVILDGSSDGLEAINTYAQPIDNGTQYPVYIVEADGTIGQFEGNDILLDAEQFQEYISTLPAGKPTPAPPIPSIMPPVAQ